MYKGSKMYKSHKLPRNLNSESHKLLRNLKSQAAIEFVLLISFMLVVFLVFFALASSKVLDMQEEKNRKIAENFVSVIEGEITLATTLKDGYYREISLPPTIEGNPYDIAILSNRELVMNYSSIEYIVFLPSNVEGNISRGYNNISKREGIVYVNHMIACGDSICEGTEDCTNCLIDCQVAPGDCCGNNICESSLGEDCSSCVADCEAPFGSCCGNLNCDPWEDCITCSNDCGFCPSGDIGCDIRIAASCTSPNIIVFRMSYTQDAHAELYNETNFNYAVCCGSTSGALNASCTNPPGGVDRRLLNLYNRTDAHVNAGGAGGDLDVCLSVDPGNLVCNAYKDRDNCPGGVNEACLATLNADTDAHAGNCTNYNNTRICCKIP